MESLAYGVTLTTISCGKCGGVYAINERLRQKCEQEGDGWHCPYCQVSWGYFANNENLRLRRELEAAKKSAELERKRKEWAEQEAMIEALELSLYEPETDGAKLREVKKTLEWWKNYAIQCGQIERPRR